MSEFDKKEMYNGEEETQKRSMAPIDTRGFQGSKVVIIGVFITIVLTLIGVFINVLDLGGNYFDSGTTSKEDQLKSLIKDNYLYYDDISEDKLNVDDLDGMVEGLGDPYSSYLDEEELRLLKEETEGRFFGIGVKFRQADDKRVYIDEVFENSSAEESGLKKGDELISVEGKKLKGDNLGDVVKLIRGKEGTRVQLEFYRESENKKIDKNIQRKEVKVSSVSTDIIEGNIGYIKISEFTDSSDEDFEQAIMKLKAKGARSFVIDLRNNPGGLVKSTVEMLDYVLPEGRVVYTKNRHGLEREWTSDEEHQLDEKMVVLINGNSASASEIFAGAMQDFGKAKIIGETSYGKGIIQQIFNLGDGTAVKLTTAEYYTPKNQKIHKRGVIPDIEVKQSSDDDEDIQLNKAIEELKK